MFDPSLDTQPTIELADCKTIISRSSVVNETQPQMGIRQRLLQALAERLQEEGGQTATHAARTFPAKTPRTIPVCNNTANPFTADYVRSRLIDCICDAQESKNFDEAIRLQHLTWHLEDGNMHPVHVVREAWLQPAAKRHHN